MWMIYNFINVKSTVSSSHWKNCRLRSHESNLSKILFLSDLTIYNFNVTGPNTKVDQGRVRLHHQQTDKAYRREFKIPLQSHTQQFKFREVTLTKTFNNINLTSILQVFLLVSAKNHPYQCCVLALILTVSEPCLTNVLRNSPKKRTVWILQYNNCCIYQGISVTYFQIWKWAHRFLWYHWQHHQLIVA